MNTQHHFQRRQIQSDCNRLIRETLQANLPFIKRLGLQKELQGHTGCVNCLQWSDCGEYLVSGSDDKNIIFWDMIRQRQKTVIKTSHEGNIFAVKFMPASSNRIIASGAADAVIQLHDVETEKLLQSYSCHMRRVKRLAVSGQSPFLLWSASEDGSIREFDVRIPHSCSTSSPCKNVLIDLRSRVGSSKEAKCVQIHPFFNERIIVGATDPFVRLFDRRKLTLSDFKSSIREGDQNIPSGGCISYFGPGYLSNRKKRTKPQKFRHYTTTHVTFSPNGEEILQYLGGEHIFLYDINDKQKPLLFTANCSHETSDKTHNKHGKRNGIHIKIDNNNSFLTSTYQMRNHQIHLRDKHTDRQKNEIEEEAMKWKQKGNDFFSKHDYFQAVVSYNNALKLSPNSSVLYANRGAALLKRAWDGDLYAALRDCQVSVRLDPTHSKAYYRQARCLFELKWYEEANICLQLFKEKFPDQTNGYSFKKFEAELRSQVKDINEAKETGECLQSVTETEVFDNTKDPDRGEKYRQYNACDYDLRFVGACNTTTDIKEANYFGGNGQYIIAGSDCGCMLLWDKSTTNLIEAWQGDESIVNCVQPHPSTCLVATSGLDPVVRLWNPRPLNSNGMDGRAKEVEELARTNQKRMNTDPLEEMLRSMGYRSFEGDGAEGEEDGNPMQCRTS